MADGGVRYAYYVLDPDNQVVQGFDNSPDIRAIKLKYGAKYRTHLHERVPHQHAADGTMDLADLMTFDDFLTWLRANLPEPTDASRSSH